MTEEQAISRKRVEYALSHLPGLETLETPASVRKARWYQESGLEGVVTVRLFRADRTDFFSGKLGAVDGNFKQFEREGKFENRPTLVIPSSGNFLKDAVAVAKGYDVEKILGILPKGISEGKKKQVEAGGRVTLMEAPEGVSSIQYAYQLASEDPSRRVMDQYTSDATIVGQGRMMEHIGREAEQLGFSEEGLLIGSVTGTGGTSTAIQRYLPSFITGPVKNFAVASHNKKEKVPASRSPEDFEELRDINGSCGFMFREEWKGVLDFSLVMDVLKNEAFAMNGELFGYNYSVGPTGALLTAGLYRLLERCHNDGTLKEMLQWLRNVVLIWMDSYFAYSEPEYRKFLTGQAG